MYFSDTRIATNIPTKVVGPIDIIYREKMEKIHVPLATFETPLWYSTKRGALAAQKSGGINTVVTDDFMTRSIILEAANAESAIKCQEWIKSHRNLIAEIVSLSSRFAKLQDVSSENVGRLLYVRICVESGNASGHNMATKAADEIADFITKNYNGLKYVSISGNYCTDKKVSAVNGILGRGKRVTADITISADVCQAILKSTPSRICELNYKKNLIGSVLAGSVRSANAHYANVALAMYLATGQDAANIVEASQGITVTDMIGENLYFSVTMPNIIVGTIGNGKHLDFARENLTMMRCPPEDPDSSERLAAIIAATVLCSELSLMAAQTNRGELMHSHVALERNSKR